MLLLGFAVAVQQQLDAAVGSCRQLGWLRLRLSKEIEYGWLRALVGWHLSPVQGLVRTR